MKNTNIFVSSNIFELVKKIPIPPCFNFTEDCTTSDYRIEKINTELLLFEKDIAFFKLVFSQENLIFIFNYLSKITKSADSNIYELQLKKFLTFQKKIFSIKELSSIPTDNTFNELITISHNATQNTHSLMALLEYFFEFPFLKNFSTILCLFHFKGHSHANVVGLKWRTEKYLNQFPTTDFNKLFSTVKKSKNKDFLTDLKNVEFLSFNGSYLAHEISSKKSNLIITASRNDFLGFTKNEIEFFKTAINLIEPHLLNLIEKEFSSNSIAELRACFNNFPSPVKISDATNSFFVFNDVLTNSFSDSDIVITQKNSSGLTLNIFENSELHSYAFDLFHFQRVSLLGELLNTLRHELSNPLFGLNLGAELCQSLIENEESKDFLKEIQNNIKRCQSIIENFSSLYLSSSIKEELTLKKVFKETLSICKSETREILIKINYDQCDENLTIHQPFLYILQILFNLIVNASQSIKSKACRGEILFEVTTDHEQVFITISDNGNGIKKDAEHLLFHPFFTTKKNGTGLGLLLSRNLAHKMNGHLEYLPFHSDIYTTSFKLTIPIK